MIFKIKYRDDLRLYDIVTIADTKKYVVVEVTYEEITLEPIEDYIMRNSCVIYNGRYQSIRELVDYKIKNFVDDRDKGKTVYPLEFTEEPGMAVGQKNLQW